MISILKKEFGKELDIDKVGENSIKFFDDADIQEYFMCSAKFCTDFTRSEKNENVDLTKILEGS